MDDKGFVFTTDLLLALIVITLAIGMTINQYESLNYQLQDFTGRQSLEKTVNDAADYLVKNPGSPKNWEEGPFNSLSGYLPGLAVVDRATTPDTEESNVFPISNYIDNKKIVALQNHDNDNPKPISKLVNTDNYYLKIVSLNSSINYLLVGKDPSTVSPPPKEIAVANRTVSLIPGDVLFQMTNLTHINPQHPANNPFLWYFKETTHGGGAQPAIFVGPTKDLPSKVLNASVNITHTDLQQYDFYIRIDVNQGGGTGVSSADYGFTGGDWVVNGSYDNTNINPFTDPLTLPYNDNRLKDAAEGELKYIYGNSNQGFIKIDNKELDTGSFIFVNDAINQTLNKRGELPVKLWFRVPSNTNADFSISLIRVRHGASLDKVPAQLILMIWE